MSFNTAISGINAANKRLEVAGNNIANSGTIGFKSSRAQFSALYSSAQLGSGRNAIGDGVRLAATQQNFNQGDSMTTSGNPLDMRIQGNGFFVVSDKGSLAYTRAGAFLKDAANFVVDSDGGRLQGYAANDKGEIMRGLRTDLQIDTSNVAARATTRVAENINLDASLPSLARLPAFDPADPATTPVPSAEPFRTQGLAPVLARCPRQIMNSSSISSRPATASGLCMCWSTGVIRWTPTAWPLYTSPSSKSPTGRFRTAATVSTCARFPIPSLPCKAGGRRMR